MDNLVCINLAHPNGLIDPVLKKGQSYPLLGIVHTIQGEPLVSILAEGEQIERPRHLFITAEQHRIRQQQKQREKDKIQKGKLWRLFRPA